MFSATKLVAAAAILSVSGVFLASGVLETTPERPPGAGSFPAEYDAVSGSGSFYGAEDATGSSRMSDPRVSGEWAIRQELHCDPEEAGYTCAKWGQAVLTNASGTWEGEWAGLHQAGDSELGLHYLTTWLTGTGDYEGLYYIANLVGEPLHTTIEGVIYEGPLPSTGVLGAVETPTE